MRVRIVSTPKGIVDGIEVEIFQVGSTYDLSPTLAGVLLLEGWAVPEQRDPDRPSGPREHHLSRSRARRLDGIS
jgi:hypothetical protein